MRIYVLALLVLTGCLTDSREGYPVDAVAQLEPTRIDLPHVTGQIELLGTGTSIDVDPAAKRTFAAYRVHISDDLAHAVTLVSADSCIVPPAGFPDRFPLQNLGIIRDVGDGAHFFTRDVQVDGRFIDVDTETATAHAFRDDLNKRIVIVFERVDGGAPVACGELKWQ